MDIHQMKSQGVNKSPQLGCKVTLLIAFKCIFWSAQQTRIIKLNAGKNSYGHMHEHNQCNIFLPHNMVKAYVKELD